MIDLGAVSRLGIDDLVGLHQFTVYEGDVEYIENHLGVLVPANPVVFESPVYKNLITTVGKNHLLDRLFGLTSPVNSNAIGFVGVGNSTTAASVGDTVLLGGSTLFQAADAGTARASNVATIKSTFGTGVANFTWNEAGISNNSTNNASTMVLFNRVIIGPFTKTSAVSIVYTTTVTQS